MHSEFEFRPIQFDTRGGLGKRTYGFLLVNLEANGKV